MAGAHEEVVLCEHLFMVIHFLLLDGLTCFFMARRWRLEEVSSEDIIGKRVIIECVCSEQS